MQAFPYHSRESPDDDRAILAVAGSLQWLISVHDHLALFSQAEKYPLPSGLLVAQRAAACSLFRGLSETAKACFAKVKNPVETETDPVAQLAAVLVKLKIDTETYPTADAKAAADSAAATDARAAAASPSAWARSALASPVWEYARRWAPNVDPLVVIHELAVGAVVQSTFAEPALAVFRAAAASPPEAFAAAAAFADEHSRIEKEKAVKKRGGGGVALTKLALTPPAALRQQPRAGAACQTRAPRPLPL